MESFIRLTSTVAPDFNVLFLAAGDLLVKLNPYLNEFIFTGVGYPPNTLLFYLFFNLLPYQIGQNVFLLISFLSLILSIYISFRVLKSKPTLLLFSTYLLLIVFSFPSKFTFGMGQNNFVVLALLLLSFWFFVKKKDMLSGLFLGLVVSFKTVFVFFLLFYLLKKRWKLLLSALFTIIVLVILTGEVFGWHLYNFYFLKVVPPLLNLEGREIYYNQGLMGFISRLTLDLNIRKYLAFSLSVILVFISSLFSLNIKNRNIQFSLFITSLVIIDTLSWQHHFVWLIFPFIVIAQKLFERKNIFEIILLVLSYVLISWNFKIYPDFSFLNPLVLSHVFIGAIILYFLELKILLDKRKNRRNL